MAGCHELGEDWWAVGVDGQESLAVDPGHGPWVLGMDSSQPLKEFPWKGVGKWAEMGAEVGGPRRAVVFKDGCQAASCVCWGVSTGRKKLARLDCGGARVEAALRASRCGHLPSSRFTSCKLGKGSGRSSAFGLPVAPGSACWCAWGNEAPVGANVEGGGRQHPLREVSWRPR